VLGVVQDLVSDLHTDKTAISPAGPDSAFNTMRDHLLQAATLGLNNVLPARGKETDQAAVDTLLALADNAISQLNDRIAEYNNMTPVDSSQSADDQAANWIAAGQTLLGNDFTWTIEFNLKLTDEMEQAYTDRDHILRHAQTEQPFPVDEWLYGVARVRTKLHALEQSMLLVENFQPDASPQLTPMQLPYKADDLWLALEYPSDYEFDGDRLLLAMVYAQPFDKSEAQAGLLVDEWVEVVPTRNETTGIAFHYDAPNSEPPNTCLLAVSPQLTGQWQWDDLIATINETLDLSKQRAVEPAHIDDTKFAQLLPATMVPTTRYLITLATNLLANVGKINAEASLPTED